MPTMDSPNVTVSVTMPEGATMEEARGYADEVQARIAQVEGVATVGATMSSESIMSMGTATTARSNVSGSGKTRRAKRILLRSRRSIPGMTM